MVKQDVTPYSKQDIDKELYGDFGNSILLDMCRNNPEHHDIEVVHGKLWLIGRAYAAAVERTSKGRVLITQAAKALVLSEIDSKIATIANISRVDCTNIDRVLDAHQYLTNLFKSVTGLAKRSLASKYLHFHAPNAVFIYDSIANTNLGKKLSGVSRVRVVDDTGSDRHDRVYAVFAHRCLYYRDQFLEIHSNTLVTPRDVDKALYETASVPVVCPMPVNP